MIHGDVRSQVDSEKEQMIMIGDTPHIVLASAKGKAAKKGKSRFKSAVSAVQAIKQIERGN